MRFVNLSGLVYGDLTVIERVYIKPKRTHWECKCVCGSITVVDSTKLKSGHTKSCGCYLKRFSMKHGDAGANRSNEYSAWAAMVKRCNNATDPSYKNYGGRGISVCKRWEDSYENFLHDMGKRPSDNHSLDRFPDNNGNYEPSNCRWATVKEQNRNKRDNVYLEYGGASKVLQDWAIHLGVSPPSISRYLKEGKSFEWVYNYFKSKSVVA